MRRVTNRDFGALVRITSIRDLTFSTTCRSLVKRAPLDIPLM